jgi:hypothetical protein
MGRAARANRRSLEGHAPAEVEMARLETAPIRVLIATWFRLMWRRYGL